MPDIILILIICAALGLSLFIGAYALFRGISYKKNYFFLMQVMIIAYLLGYLLELTSVNAEEAYLGVKILDASASFVAVFAFLFVADYCNVKLHNALVKIPMLALPVAISLLMWSAKLNHLLYRDYRFVPNLTRHLDFTPGHLYFLTYSYPVICMVLAMALLLFQMKKWKNRYRKQLLILLICVIIPLTVDSVYYIFLLTGRFLLYFTPHSLAIMSLCIYVGLMRHSILEVIPNISAMDHIREGFVLVDESDNFLFSNPAALQILPGISQLHKGESILSAEGWPGELKSLVSGSVEFSIGDKRHFRASISHVFTQNRNLIAKIILFADVTDNVLLMKKLENAAYIDALTGLYNRKHFFELANADIERAQRLNQSIHTAMLDLDFFKEINDSYGHAAGDLVLMKVSSVMRHIIRSYDLLCRYGGEEFVLLIANLDDGEAFNLMERIRKNMECEPTDYEGKEIKCTCSIGLAKFVEGDTLEESIKKADEAQYVAKKSGRNQVQVYNPGT